jgi:hypothetical protein
MIRPMTDKERQRAKEKQVMNTASMSAEIQLYNAMTRNKLNVKEAIEAMNRYANDKDFQKQLDDYYGSELYIADDFEEVTSDH